LSLIKVVKGKGKWRFQVFEDVNPWTFDVNWTYRKQKWPWHVYVLVFSYLCNQNLGCSLREYVT